MVHWPLEKAKIKIFEFHQKLKCYVLCFFVVLVLFGARIYFIIVSRLEIVEL